MNEAPETAVGERPLSLIIKDAAYEASREAVASLAVDSGSDYADRVWDTEELEAAQRNGSH